ncbi:MAG: hypothetical protein JXK16_09040 [Thiotrichales bacterium]|nr:hypothetical protein [Thiotrichales bacterium]
MNAILVTLLIPITLALLSGFVAERRLKALNLAGSVALLISAVVLLMSVAQQGTLSLNFGAWPVPFGIRFEADGLSALMITVIALVFFCVLLISLSWRNAQYQANQFILMQGLITSAIAVTLTVDLFNLYVWFELMLMSVLGLMVINAKLPNYEAAIKYFTINMLGTLLMLAMVGLIYGSSGHLNFQALGEASQQPELASSLSLYGALLFIALLMKMGTFPLFIWLPASYHALPLPLLALIGGLLTKITAYVLLRLSGQVFNIEAFYDALGWLAVLTMLSGVIGAAYHWDLRRILAFHIISQVGFILLGIALASQAAAVGTTIFLIHNILVKTNLFLIAGAIWLAVRHYDLRNLGGLYPAKTLLAILFLINAMALVGVPPTSGFWGKFLILKEAFIQEHFIWAIAALVTGLLTLYSMSKIWLEAFWKPATEAQTVEPIPLTVYAPIILLTLVVAFIGLYPEPLIVFLEPLFNDFYGGVK